ncbi:MAG: peroxiredoxin family protein [Flavobacteriaceae bacterium]|nr:peroxiredoxin family protein [Flavobacteriaceae bacterium]
MRKLLILLALAGGFNALAQIDNVSLKIGDKAPKFKGIDQFDKTINSDQILKNKPILMVFYRGSWCTYCKKHLTELQENLEAFTQKGYYVVVVTPEKVEKSKEITDKLKLGFSILHDADNKIMADYKVLYDVNEQNVTDYYEIIKQKVAEYNVSNNLVLPVTATYIINKKGKIDYVQFNPDYSKRADFKELLKTL